LSLKTMDSCIRADLCHTIVVLYIFKRDGYWNVFWEISVLI